MLWFTVLSIIKCMTKRVNIFYFVYAQICVYYLDKIHGILFHIQITQNTLFSKVCWQHPAMFCLYSSSKLSRPYFEFSLKVKVMGSNAGYFLKSFLLYVNLPAWKRQFSHLNFLHTSFLQFTCRNIIIWQISQKVICHTFHVCLQKWRLSDMRTKINSLV